MNDEEYVANIPNLSNEDLLAGLISCGHDGYYNVLYYPIINEIKKRLTSYRTGVWKYVESETVNGICSVCGYESHLYENDVYGEHYCPNCGAWLRLE